MSAHTLAKCPFCGSAAYTQRRDINGRMPAPPETYPSTWFACCENDETCGAEVGRFHSEEEAVSAWERRMAKATHEVLDFVGDILGKADVSATIRDIESRRLMAFLNREGEA